MKIIFFLMIYFIAVFADIGKITGIKGDVFVFRDTKKLTAKVGFSINLKDKIVTKARSKALILFNDHTSITVGKNSTLDIEKFVLNIKEPSKSEAEFKFGVGIFRTITGKIGKLNRKKFQIKTSMASIGIRGSIGTTIVSPNGELKHITHAGGFTMTDNKTGKMIVIMKGLTGRLSRAGLVVAPTTVIDLEEAKDVSKENDFDKKEEKKEDVEKTKKEKKKVKKEEIKKEKIVDETEKQDEVESVDDVEDVTSLKTNVESVDNSLLDSVSTKVEEAVDDTEDIVIDNIPDSVVNSVPTIELEQSSISVDQGELSSININIEDAEDSLDNLNIELKATNGTVSISNGKLVYLGNDYPYINDVITIIVEDSSGAKTVKQIPVTIITSNLSDSTTPPDMTSFDTTTIAKEIMGSDTYDNATYMESGYILDSVDGERVDTYVYGQTTPSVVIDQYISGANVASYNGNIYSLITDIDGNTVSKTGTINLNMDFGEQTFSGSALVDKFNMNINNGTLTNSGFASSDITGTVDGISDISGTLDGNFYGATANGIGGNIHVTSSSSGSLTGSFIGSKE